MWSSRSRPSAAEASRPCHPPTCSYFARRVGRRREARATICSLLAAVNRGTAESGRPGSKTVSPGCVASYLSPDGGIETRVVGDDGAEKTIQAPPYLWFGVDFTEMMRTTPRWDPATRQWVDKPGAVVDPKDWWRPEDWW